MFPVNAIVLGVAIAVFIVAVACRHAVFGLFYLIEHLHEALFIGSHAHLHHAIGFRIDRERIDDQADIAVAADRIAHQIAVRRNRNVAVGNRYALGIAVKLIRNAFAPQRINIGIF